VRESACQGPNEICKRAVMIRNVQPILQRPIESRLHLTFPQKRMPRDLRLSSKISKRPLRAPFHLKLRPHLNASKAERNTRSLSCSEHTLGPGNGFNSCTFRCGALPDLNAFHAVLGATVATIHQPLPLVALVASLGRHRLHSQHLVVSTLRF
jgi:hypothetical protein